MVKARRCPELPLGLISQACISKVKLSPRVAMRDLVWLPKVVAMASIQRIRNKMLTLKNGQTFKRNLRIWILNLSSKVIVNINKRVRRKIKTLKLLMMNSNTHLMRTMTSSLRKANQSSPCFQNWEGKHIISEPGFNSYVNFI